MQDGGGGALRGAAAPAGSGASRLRDEWAGTPGDCEGEPAALSPRAARRPDQASGRRAGRRRAAPGQRPRGLSAPAAAAGWRGGRGAGRPRGRDPAWLHRGVATEGGPLRLLRAFGVSAAVERAGGGLREGKISAPVLRKSTEQLGTVEGSEDGASGGCEGRRRDGGAHRC